MARKKNAEEIKNRFVMVRLTQQDFGVLQQKAVLYTEGNLSHWIRTALKYYNPKHLREDINQHQQR